MLNNNKNINISQINKVFFCGIGGIGMSALAEMFILRGAKVFGSDRSESNIIEKLREKGAEIYIGHSAENIPKSVEIFVYTTAIPEDNPELLKAKELSIPCFTYPELLGIFSKNYKTIAVSGTHGKTTTTAMASSALLAGGFDPIVVVGSILLEKGSNFIAGGGEWFLVEACEYKRAFLNLSPEVLIITNIEADHLDYYKDLEDVKSAFRELCEKVSKNGYIICDMENKDVRSVVENAKAKVLNYRDFIQKTEFLESKGKHNVLNGACVMALAEVVFKMNYENTKKALLGYKGTWRRFEYKGETKEGVFVYDDYAHHPSEVKATLNALRSLAEDAKIIAIFQPHLFSRTRLFLENFAKSFENANEVLVAPIYAAREKDDGSIKSSDLVEKIKENGGDAKALGSFDKIIEVAKSNASGGDYIITMGAGDIFKVSEDLIK